MPKIFFDHQKFSTQKYGGISRYFANIIENIETNPAFTSQLGVLTCNNQYLKKDQLPLNKYVGSSILNSKLGKKSYDINQRYCNHLLKQNQFDIFHPTYYDTYFTKNLKKPLIITVHDMTHERIPEYFWAQDTLTHNKRINIEQADLIIAISETTKKDVLTYTNVDEKKIRVVYHGIDLEHSIEPVANPVKNYLLFVGDRGGYKNFFVFLNSFKQISLKFPEIKVVLTGGGKLEIAEKEYINHLKLGDKIIHFNVNDAQLNYLYTNALAFVYPSLHEGFGLPILEAYKNQCPVILSDTECFREIAQDAALFFETNSPESLTKVIENILTDSELKSEMIHRGSKQLSKFSLIESMDQTLSLYQELCP